MSRTGRVFDPSLLLHSSPYATPFDKVLSRVELEKAGVQIFLFYLEL